MSYCRERLLEFGNGYVPEFYRTAFALQTDMSFCYAIRSGILVNTVDIDRDDTVLNKDIRLVPFPCRVFGRGFILLDHGELGPYFAGEFRQVRTSEEDEVSRIAGM